MRQKRRSTKRERFMVSFTYPDESGSSFFDVARLTVAEAAFIRQVLESREDIGEVTEVYVGPEQVTPTSYDDLREKLANALPETRETLLGKCPRPECGGKT